MSSTEDIRLEVLRIAKDLVVGHYTDARAELHNRWVEESDRLWKSQRLRLAYPPIPPFPTEADILAKAQTLMEFLGIESRTGAKTEVVVEPAPADNGEDALPDLLKKIEVMKSKIENTVGSSDD